MDIKELWQKYYNALKQQEWTKALSALNSINEKKPGNSQVHLKMGDLMQRMGNNTGAIESYHKAAFYLVKEGFIQKAAAIFKIILRLDPKNTEAAIKLERVFEAAASSKTAFLPFAASTEEAQPDTSESQFGEVPKPAEIPQPVEPPKQAEIPSYGEMPFPDIDPKPSKEKELGPGYGEITLDDEEIAATEKKILEAFVKEPQIKEEKHEKQEEKDFDSLEDFDDLLAEVARELPVIEERSKPQTDLPAFLMPLGENKAREFLKKSVTRTYRAGERIINEGDTGDSLFFIRKGSAKVVAHILGKEFVLTTLGNGDIFGEVTFLTGRPRTASVVAEADNEVLEFNRELIEEAISKNPEVLECLNDLYDTRVLSTMKKIVGE